MKLAMKIVFWGSQLDRFLATVFLKLFPTIDKDNMNEFVNIFAPTVLKKLDSRGQVILIQSVDSTVMKVSDLLLHEAW